ncbi:MAG: segregation/condensation protein A [Candidatus Coatesbacteria bacterium]|nr:segregation/condensation protein A [Candidatus Coatesbacteria bacterium]
MVEARAEQAPSLHPPAGARAEQAPPLRESASEFRIQVQNYSGPLDLFVYLVKQEKLDLLSISVLGIVQNLAKFLAGRSCDLDAAGEAMLLTANLLYLKSRLLLPDLFEDDELEEELREPSAVLVQRILQYEEARAMAEGLAEKERSRRALWFSGDSSQYAESEEDDIVGASVVDLALSFVGLLTRDEAEQVQFVSREKYSIAETVVRMVAILKEKPSVSMREVLSHARDIEEKLAFFLALLELVKFSLVAAVQRRDSFNIRLRLLGEADVELLRLELGAKPESGRLELTSI